MKINLFQEPSKNKKKLHPQYIKLKKSHLFKPARTLLREIQKTFEDPDGNFVEQFQTSGFDQRTFELFLNELFKESKFTIHRNHDRPDFILDRGGLTVAVEAVTANPSNNKGPVPYQALPDSDTLSSDVEQLLRHEIPIRLGSPLYSKLKKKYWELPQVQGKPLVIAIQDFSRPGSLSSSSSGLMQYLYGAEFHTSRDSNDNLQVHHRKIDEHVNEKKKIPSGFFELENSENISGVLFCNNGTIPTFNRIAHSGKGHDSNLRIIRYGTHYRHDPNATMPAPFMYEVGAKDSIKETWSQGTIFFHNPNALHPIPIGWLGASADMYIKDNEHLTIFHDEFHPYMSLTMMLDRRQPQEDIEGYLAFIWNELMKNSQIEK